MLYGLAPEKTIDHVLNSEGYMAKSLVCETCWSGMFSFDSWQAVLSAREQPRQWGYSKGYRYITTWESIHASASSGCNWCQFISHPKYTRGEVEICVAYDEDADCTPAGTKQLTVKLEGSGAFSSRHYYMYTDADDNAAKFVAARDRVLDVESPLSYQLALECLDHCARLHERCPKPTATTLPDRVIDCSMPENPKIVLTGGIMEGFYVALSYIWGAPQPTSNMQNIDTFVTQGLNMSEFPNTIREAVSVTHSLGLRYLWIDALCIIQDSGEDKVRQIGMMGKIYQNSYVTIVAACGKSVNEGFLHQHRPRKISDARIPYRCPDGTIGSVWIAETLDARPNDCSRSYYDDLEPINYRGWCLQERLLSSRCLIYASHTLQYDCQTETVNIGQALCEKPTISRLPSIVLPASPTDLQRARRAWISTVWDYSSRNLTVSADKLVAFAGVAECFQRFFDGSYLAGLWENSLLIDLLWLKVSDEPLPRTRPTEYRAPSWSWASIDGRVQFRFLEQIAGSSKGEIVECEVVGCEVTVVSKDVPFGQVAAGTLTLNGLLKKVMLESGGKPGKVFIRSDLDSEPINIGWARLDAMEERGNTYVIPLMWDDGGTFVEGLIVSEVSDGYVQRLGHFSNNYKSADIKWVEGISKQVIKIV